jgi:hypothetical protein
MLLLIIQLLRISNSQLVVMITATIVLGIYAALVIGYAGGDDSGRGQFTLIISIIILFLMFTGFIIAIFMLVLRGHDYLRKEKCGEILTAAPAPEGKAFLTA